MASLAETCGLHPLAEHHLADLQRLASAPELAATTRLPHPYPADGARVFFERLCAERAAGTAWVFAVEHARRLVGVVGLHGITTTTAELGYWIGVPHQRRGYGRFAVQNVLPFAFDNLRLASLWAEVLASNTPSMRLLSEASFQPVGERAHTHATWPAGVPLRRCELTADAWRTARDAPALAALHPALRAQLDAELAAGNSIRETGRGWPDPDSVFVRLRHAFRALPVRLPAGVVHTVLNDPHWWTAELATQRPRHTLAF